MSKHRQVVLVKLDQFHTRCDHPRIVEGIMKMLHRYAAMRHGTWVGSILEWKEHELACKLGNGLVEFLGGNSISGSEGIADHFVAKWRWSGKLGELAKRFWWKTIKSSLQK